MQKHHLYTTKIINPTNSLHGKLVQQTKVVKCLGLLLETFTQENTTNPSRKLKSNIEYKLLIYKVIINPIWTYGIPQREWLPKAISQRWKLCNLFFRTIVNAPWYIKNEDLRKDLQIFCMWEEIQRFSDRCKGRTANHQNPPADTLYVDNVRKIIHRMIL